MDDPTNLLRFDAAVLDQLRLEAQTRTYVLLSKHGESWGYSAGFCAPGPWPQARQPAVSVSFTFGFQLIPAEEVHGLMRESKRVGSD